MASIYGYELKNIRTWQGRDWEGCQGHICYNGKKVGWYHNNGDGSCTDIDFYLSGKDRAKNEQHFNETIKQYYADNPLQPPYEKIIPDGEIFIGEMLELMDSEKCYKKFAKDGYPFMVQYSEKYGTISCAACNTIAMANELYNKYSADPKVTNVKMFKGLDDFNIQQEQAPMENTPTDLKLS